jgi:hypothetical protein
MANSFKTLLPEDIATTRTLLHEAIPITGTIVSGTYIDDANIKTFAHGMYEAVYDYPYLSSSANHIFDITAGYSPNSALSSSTNEQNAKKINIYNQMAQVLVGYDVDGNIQEFDIDGNLGGGDKMKECFFINFSRLLTKDEIKKDSFRLALYASSSGVSSANNRSDLGTIGDYGAQTEYLTNSPAGEYGLLYTSSATPVANGGSVVGHVYYQAGVAVVTASYFTGAFGDPDGPGAGLSDGLARQVDDQLTGSTITQLANGIRYTWDDLDFNNTTELNSTIYFCRANNTEYNYSSNPTYLSASEIRVKGSNPLANPVSYITTVGLYSPDNELLAVAKLSEPLKKSPSNELTLRVRLDY